MASRGSALQRAVTYFREGSLDEVRVAFQLVKEVVESRLADAKTKAKSQVTALTTPRKRRRTRAEIEADKAKDVTNTTQLERRNAGDQPAHPHQTTIQEKHGTVAV